MPGVREPTPDEPPPPGPDRMSPLPFVVALVSFVVIAVLAIVFLRPDDEGQLVRPDRLAAVDDDTIRAVAIDRPRCLTVDRAQVDLGETTVHVELVVVDDACGDATDRDTVDLVAEITLPEPVGDRRVLAGVGRLELPCSGQGSTVTCAPAG